MSLLSGGSPLRRALLQERAALEERLQHVNSLLQQENVPSAAMALTSPLTISNNTTLGTVELLSASIGVTPEMLRLTLLVMTIAYLWFHGRALVRHCALLLTVGTVTIWSYGRRFSRALKPARS